MAMNFDKPAQTTGEMLQNYINTDGPEDVPGSDDLVSTLLDEDKAVPAAQAAASDGGSPDGTYVVKKGDNLTKISQELGIPLKDFAAYNGITDVKLPIYPGTEFKYALTNAPSNGININGEQITMQKGGTNEGGILGEPEKKIEGEELGFTDNAFEDSSDVGTQEFEAGVDVGAQATKDKDLPKDLAKGAVTDKPLTDTIAKKISSKNLLNNGLTQDYIMRVISETFLTDDPTVKTAFEQYKTDISTIKFDNESELRTLLDKQQKEITSEINSYQTKIDAVAKEEFIPKLEGWNKFMAVLGAAFGSYGASMTGTPNFALNILNKAIDRDAQEFADSKEMRVSTLEQQRLALRERRGQLLGMAENAVTRLQNTVNTKLATAESLARVQQLQEQITSAKEESFRGFLGDLAANMSKQATGQAKIDAALTASESERRVEGMVLPNEEGVMTVLEPFLAKTKEQQIKITSAMITTAALNDELQEMKKLFDDPGIWAPEVFAGAKAKLVNHFNVIYLLTKEINNMGANFTVLEQAMIKAIIPRADVVGRLGTAKVAAELMQRRLFQSVENIKKAHGATPITMQSLYTTNTGNSQSVPTLTKISNK